MFKSSLKFFLSLECVILRLFSQGGLVQKLLEIIFVSLSLCEQFYIQLGSTVSIWLQFYCLLFLAVILFLNIKPTLHGSRIKTM